MARTCSQADSWEPPAAQALLQHHETEAPQSPTRQPTAASVGDAALWGGGVSEANASLPSRPPGRRGFVRAAGLRVGDRHRQHQRLVSCITSPTIVPIGRARRFHEAPNVGEVGRSANSAKKGHRFDTRTLGREGAKHLTILPIYAPRGCMKKADRARQSIAWHLSPGHV
jgi:hypothetical protein